ncbi:CoA-ligase [Malassezia pachydermatis]
MPLLYPCPQTTRKSTTPISLGQVRAQAKAMATSLLSPHIEGGAWKRGDVIVVYSENQHDYLLAVLGVMMSGGVAALSNPMYKPDEMRHVFDLTKPRAILASVATYEKAVQAAKSYEELCKHDITVYVFDEDHERSYLKLLVEPGMKLYNDGDDAVHRVPFSPKEQDAIYCFSSGTSGLPKAVRLSHFNLIANAIQMTATLGGRINKPSEKFMQWYDQPEAPIQDGKNEIHYSILPQFHCYGMLTSLINLHTLTPAVIAARFSPETFFSTVEEFHVTFAFVVPPIMIALVRSPLAKKYDLSSIKSLASGAASLSKELCELVRDKYGLHVTDGYGMTEMSPIIALQTQRDLQYHKLNVGRLVSNTEAYVIDVNTGKKVGVNKPGELLVRGPQMMQGYLGNEKANQSAFAMDDEDSGRFLRTGDIVSFDDKGYITIHDRVKDIIKYNGYQIAASEIEAIINSIPHVLESAVVGKIVKEDVAKNELPWAFIVLRSDAPDMSEEKRSEEVISYVNERVAGYKKLRGITWTDQLPRSAAGKVLKRELRDQLSLD